MQSSQQPFFINWTTDTSGSMNYRTGFLENDRILLKKPFILKTFSSASVNHMWPAGVQGPDGSEWRRLTGQTWKTLKRLCWDVSPGRQAGRQKYCARILKCASIVFQDILSSPLRNRTAGKACSRLRWEGAGRDVAMWCQMIFTTKGLKLALIGFFSASESKLNVLQHANAQRCQQMGGLVHPPRPSALLPPLHQFATVKN